MSRLGIGLLLVTMSAARPALAQTDRPAFDAASVKATDGAGDFVEVKGATVTAHAARISTCIAWAYDVPTSQVTAADSVGSVMLRELRYDIVAKANGNVTPDRIKLMFQTLFADRFKLRVDRQPREMQNYALVVERSGQKFRVSDGDGASTMRMASKLTRACTHTTMTQFANILSEAMQAPVVDETGLRAKYDLSLDLTPYLPANASHRPDAPR